MSGSEKITKIAAISGSLRQYSYNTGLLHELQAQAKEPVTLEILEIGNLPLYSGDTETEAYPKEAIVLKEKVKMCQGLIIATPEYNYSVPGVLKNAIDWLSRPPVGIPLIKKPVAILGASTGVFGSARAQYHLRQSLVCLNAYVMNRPEIFVGNAAEKFDDQGKLTDQETQERLGKFLSAFLAWMEQLAG